MRWAFEHSRLTLLVIAWAVSSSAALLVQHGSHTPLCRRSSVIAWRTRSHPVAIDASLAADAVITSASQLPTYVVPEDPHTLANLGPDLLNTAMVSLLGLVGAYVTQVCAHDGRHGARNVRTSLSSLPVPHRRELKEYKTLRPMRISFLQKSASLSASSHAVLAGSCRLLLTRTTIRTYTIARSSGRKWVGMRCLGGRIGTRHVQQQTLARARTPGLLGTPLRARYRRSF